MELLIRAARIEDAPALRAIYAPYVEHTAVSYEYEVPTAEEFAARIRRTLARYPYLVCECGGQAIGYAYADRLGERRAYDWAVETSIYVAPQARRCGAGRALYAALERALRAQGVTGLFACIASSDEADDPYLTRDSIAFHTRMGYRMCGELRGCGVKFGRRYNTVWMEKHLGEAIPTAPVLPFPAVRHALAL